jgi:hypothetical protein
MDVIALVAFFDMAAEHSGAANLDGAHDTQLFARQFVRGAVSLSVLSKNVGQLESRPAHGLRLRPQLGIARQFVERAGRARHDMRGHLRIARGGIDAAVAQQRLNNARIGSLFEQMSGE